MMGSGKGSGRNARRSKEGESLEGYMKYVVFMTY